MPVIAGGKFVVIGGASQIGSHIGQQLLAAGAREVVLVDNLWLGTTETMQPLLADPRCSFVRGDVLRLNELHDPLAEADGAFHVAGIMASTIAENPGASLDVNIRGVFNTLEACRYQGVRKVIYSSSAGLYGWLEDPVTDESSPYRWQVAPPPSRMYGAGKIIGEALAQHYKERHGIDYVALRYTAVYGERQHVRAVMGGHVAETCQRLREGLPPVIDGSQVQDYIYVGDVARANRMAMESDVSGEGINIVTGRDTSQKRIVEIAIAASGSDLQPEYRSFKVLRLPPATRQNMSNAKAKRLLGWEPQVTIEQGVARVLRWIDERRASTT
jgi:UDP-glucose 4-epimerase